MDTNGQLLKDFHRKIAIIHGALFFGQAIFAIIAWILNINGTLKIVEKSFNFLLPIIIFIIIGVFAASFFVFRSRLVLVKGVKVTEDKLNSYNAALIMKYALLEMATFFALICFLLTSIKIYFIIAVIVILIFALNRPTKDKLISDLEFVHNDDE